MSEEISHQSVFDEMPQDPLESEYTVQYYVQQLSEEVVERLPTDEIRQKSRETSNNHLTTEEAVVGLAESWFDSHVSSENMDSDVYQAARNRAVNYMVAQLPSNQAS